MSLASNPVSVGDFTETERRTDIQLVSTVVAQQLLCGQLLTQAIRRQVRWQLPRSSRIYEFSTFFLPVACDR
jgi:hypothetical protein